MHPPLYPLFTAPRWLAFGTRFLGWKDRDQARAKILLQKNMLPIVNGPEIGVLLGISARIVTRASSVPERYYKTFKIKKKSGAFREISAPRVYLKVIQRYLLDCILVQARLPSNVIGFVRGKSMGDGASAHVGARFMWNIDLKDFFPSVEQDRVVEIFQSLGYDFEPATFLTKLCCLGGRLPQGAPTSPMLANLAFAPADIRILKECAIYGVTYTRYADDLSFSCSKAIPELLQRKVALIIADNGFIINDKKTRLLGPKCRREVTGLTINTRVSVPREIRRKVRAMMHNYSHAPSSVDLNLDQLRGYASYIGGFHPGEAARYMKILSKRKLASEEGCDPET